MSNEMKLFRLALKRFLLSNSFYSIDILTAIIINELSLKYSIVLQLFYFIVTIFILINNIILYFKSLHITATIICRLSSHITH